MNMDLFLILYGLLTVFIFYLIIIPINRIIKKETKRLINEEEERKKKEKEDYEYNKP